jgi:hypothetical protein
MSFASDLGQLIGSEKHFISRTPPEDRRKFWKNAAELVKLFINEKTPAAMGFQEMNDRNKVKLPDSTQGSFVGGFQALLESLGTTSYENDVTFNNDYYTTGKTGEYCFLAYSVPGQFGAFPTLLTIWHKTLGDFDKFHGGDIGLMDYYNENKLGLNNIGRPISIVRTTNGFNLINLHGPNDPTTTEEQLVPVIVKFITDTENNMGTMDSDKTFIMGDFNDPYGNIKNISYYTYSGNAVKSCCYNFNSSCDDNEFKNYTTEPELNDPNQNYEVKGIPVTGKEQEKDKFPECRIVRNPTKDDTGKIIPNDIDMSIPGSTARDLGDRGYLKNYRFTGDYVLGKTPESDIQTYRPNGEVVSSESDHELVYATFRIPATTINASAGGKRSSRKKKAVKNRKTKKARTKRNKRSRKYSWM